jgi:hypothetical protein
MVKSYGMCTFNEHPAQFRFDTLKTDQALPVSIFIWKGWCFCLVGRLPVRTQIKQQGQEQKHQ